MFTLHSENNDKFAPESRTFLEKRPGAAVRTDVVEMNVTSAEGARYFVTIIDEASRHPGACQVKKKGEAAELIKRHYR